MAEYTEESGEVAAATAVKLPKTLGACVDLLYKTRQKRYSLQKQAKELEALEKAISNHLVDEVPKGDSSGVSGKLARVTITTKKVPQVSDWNKLYAFIKRTGDFSLLGRKLASKAVEERWENKKTVPGVESYNAIKLGLNKL